VVVRCQRVNMLSLSLSLSLLVTPCYMAFWREMSFISVRCQRFCEPCNVCLRSSVLAWRWKHQVSPTHPTNHELSSRRCSYHDIHRNEDPKLCRSLQQTVRRLHPLASGFLQNMGQGSRYNLDISTRFATEGNVVSSRFTEPNNDKRTMTAPDESVS